VEGWSGRLEWKVGVEGWSGELSKQIKAYIAIFSTIHRSRLFINYSASILFQLKAL
jgi:hypothetical protein